MQLQELKPKYKIKKKKRVGRGGKRGTYSGKGQKGQKSRAGRRMQPVIRELIKKVPKLKGYKVKRIKSNIVSINIRDLDKAFKAEDIVNPKNLLEKKIVRRIKGRTPKIKILAKGEIKKTLIIEKCAVSEAAKKAIEKAGGKIK